MSDGTYTDVDKGYVDAADARVLAEAKAYADALFASVPQPEPPEPPTTIALGWPVYGPDTIAGWSIDDPQYERLASSGFGSDCPVAPSIPTHDESSDSVDASLFAKGRSVLFATSGDQQYQDEAWERLDAFSEMDLVWSNDNDSRLSLSWMAINVAVAAKLSDYDLNRIEPWLRYVYPYMDWTSGVNWDATFFDARLAIATLLDDRPWWDEGRALGELRLAQGVHHPDYDGEFIVPRRGDGFFPEDPNDAPNEPRTEAHWNNQVAAPDYRAVFQGVPLPKGCDGERMRDIYHPSMTIAGFCDGANTIVAAGDTVTAEMHDRLMALAEHQSTRVLHFLQTGEIPAPIPNNTSTSNVMYLYGWCKANRYLGTDAPESLTAILQESRVRNVAGGGTLFISAELMADGLP